MDAVDFVIPHMGRPELLLETLESVFAQNRPEQIASVTVVTKNEAPLAVKEHDKLNIIRAPTASTISEQRNIGVAAGRAPLIAFLDADIGLAMDWLETCTGLLAQMPERVLVSAMQKSSENAGRVERLRVALSNVSLDEPVQFLPGRNLLVKRSAHDKVGGFPEHLKTCEDYYYTEKLSQLGDLYYTSQTHYVHLGEDRTLRQTFTKEIWRSEYNLFSLSGRKVPLREWPSILLPFWMLLGLVVAVMGVYSQTAFFIGLMMLLLPILLYSVRLFVQQSNHEPLHFLVLFYSVYFVARAAGTVKGTRLLLTRDLTE
ncbi:glycosyltransferase family 2 protein [Marinobacter sp. F4216]|uniref:glycosyltransferase family 2 protein n=1 Tax=Marinobacter sp. F4216 TaxID=2874281 RepID=UPI001CBB8841|nr:glycosyltransferase family A protein [Marinobacter sp. F4216]MBZ2167678.1 glycosyltransferase family 2 protein [Marinobacter sp. F4216]